MRKNKFKIGDWFVYNIKLMKENGYYPDQYDKRVRRVVSVEHHEGLGEIVGYGKGRYPAQCNAIWLKRYKNP